MGEVGGVITSYKAKHHSLSLWGHSAKSQEVGPSAGVSGPTMRFPNPNQTVSLPEPKQSIRTAL